jgi:hypothetical protein
VFYAGLELAIITGIQVAAPGAHDAYLWLQDGAGNIDRGRALSVTLQYDPEPPAAPQNLTVQPDAWAATDRFELAWSNPADTSGILTACYKLDEAPKAHADADGCQTATGIDVLTDLSVPEDGRHLAFVWLVDAADNTDPGTARSIPLFRDMLAPESVASTPPQVEAAPIPVRWAASDQHSGVDSVALWAKAGDSGAWKLVDSAPGGSGAGLFLYQPEGEGMYYFATVVTDQAGNAETLPTGTGDTQTMCTTWQRVYLPAVLKQTLSPATDSM